MSFKVQCICSNITSGFNKEKCFFLRGWTRKGSCFDLETLQRSQNPFASPASDPFQGT